MLMHFTKTHNLIGFIKYTLSGSVAVVIDISVLYLLHTYNNIAALAVAVTISSFIHYLISRYWVFKSKRRRFLAGYIHFISVIGLSIALNSGLYLLLIAVVPLPFFILRVVSIALVGIISYILNAHYTFGTFVKSR